MDIWAKTAVTCGLLALVACDSSTDRDPLGPGAATLSAGCYTLAFGPWDEPGTIADPPAAFQLTDEPWEGDDSKRLIQPLPGHAAWDYTYALWTPTGDLLFEGSGPSFYISLTGSESPFHGQAEVWHAEVQHDVTGSFRVAESVKPSNDVQGLTRIPERPRATATLASTPCPA